jgi:hypothetical protein
MHNLQEVRERVQCEEDRRHLVLISEIKGDIEVVDPEGGEHGQEQLGQRTSR